MKLDNYFEVSILLGYYKNLLSKKQKEYMIAHFEEDYSLSEIAEKHGISRQAVYDNIKRGVKILKEYEQKLEFYKKDTLILKQLKKLKENYNEKKLDEIINRIET